MVLQGFYFQESNLSKFSMPVSATTDIGRDIVKKTPTDSTSINTVLHCYQYLISRKSFRYCDQPLNIIFSWIYWPFFAWHHKFVIRLIHYISNQANIVPSRFMEGVSKLSCLRANLIILSWHWHNFYLLISFNQVYFQEFYIIF